MTTFATGVVPIADLVEPCVAAAAAPVHAEPSCPASSSGGAAKPKPGLPPPFVIAARLALQRSAEARPKPVLPVYYHHDPFHRLWNDARSSHLVLHEPELLFGENQFTISVNNKQGTFI